MGQNVPGKYLQCIQDLFAGGGRAEASSSSASAEDAEISALNNAETQAARIIRENPWRLWQANGERVTIVFRGAVVVIREYWKVSTSQQEALGSEGVTLWERCPLSGHAVLYFSRAWGLEG